MNAVRPPVIAGLGRRVGTSTLAAALHAVDGGLLAPGTAGEADILVCRADEPSLRQAAALAFPPGGPGPVLALIGAAAPPTGTVARRFTAVVALPHVDRWAGRDDAGREAGAVLAFPADDLPTQLHSYAGALHMLVVALTGSGLLRRATPMPISRPTTSTLWHGLRPVATPARRAARPEPDDDALEDEPRPVAAGRTG